MRLSRIGLLLLTISATALAATWENVEYVKRGDVSLKLDAWVPDAPGLYPAVIIVHGGGFVRGDKQTYVKPLFPVLTQAGYAWFTIDYRLAPASHFAEQIADVEDAVRWVKLNSKKYRVDPTRIALVGESAGGLLVSYVGAVRGSELGLSAVVPFYAPHDLLGRAEKAGTISESIQAFLGIGPELTPESRYVLRQASPYYHVRASMPPYLLIHGTKDTQVDYQQSVEMQKKLRAAGVTCDLLTVTNGGHGMGNWEKDQMRTVWKNYLVQWLHQRWTSRRTLPSFTK
jgi:acetyl esterase